MAELSYDDVRRAAQDAMRELSQVVRSIQNSHNDLKRAVQQNANNQYALSDVIAKLGALQQQINTITTSLRGGSGGAQQPAPIHYSIQQSVSDVQRRLSSVEQFVAACYRYFDAQQRRENEENGFRNA